MTSPRKSMWYPKEEKEEPQTRKVVHDFVLVFFLCKLYDSWRHYFMQLDYIQKILNELMSGMLFVQGIPTSAVHRFKWDRSSFASRHFDWWKLKLINYFGVSYFLRARVSPEWRLNPGFGNQKIKNSWANKISCPGLVGCPVLFFCRCPVPFMSFIGYRKRLSNLVNSSHEELAWGFEPIRNGEIFWMNKYFNFFVKT